jgi:integrase
MANWENFTAGRVAAFACPEGRADCFYWDGKVPSLGVKVYASGRKSFIFQTKVSGRTIRITIGDVRVWPIGKAQAEATKLKTLTDQGLDPRELNKTKKAESASKRAHEKAKTLFVQDAWGVYLAYQKDKMSRPHIERGKKWGERHLQDHERLSQKGGELKIRGKGLTKQGVLYPILSMKMGDISATVLVHWQQQEAKERANKARQGFEMFRTFWRWCAQNPEYKLIIDADAIDARALRDEVPSRKSRRNDSLERGHLALWFQAVCSLESRNFKRGEVERQSGGARNQNNQIAKTYLQALLLTGARREEMAPLRWEDVSFERNSLWIKDKVEGDNKEAGEGRRIPLTPYLKTLLMALPKRNKYVFSSLGSNCGYITEPSSTHNRALDKAIAISADFPRVTVHGLRRSFISLSEWVEIPVGVIAQIVGHKPSGTAERHYKHRPLELLEAWHSKYESWILKEAGVEFKNDLVALNEIGSINSVAID